ncbi:MAG: hypothetical protein KC543_15700, partial [Myxococcales bacterium]|nr:hypothetical protein [Myxococcales bacterium]
LYVARLHGTGVLRLPAADRLFGLTVLEGAVSVDAGAGAGSVRVAAGRSAALPAALQRTGPSVTLERAHAVLSAAL